MSSTSFKISLIVLLLSTLITSKSFAQAAGGSSGSSSLAQESLRDAYIVGGCGLAGAILGLSTLSFVDEPKEHTRNIVMGAAVGIVAGVAVVAYFQANSSRNIMGTSSISPINASDFSSKERLAMSQEITQERAVNFKKDPFQFSVNLSF